MKKIKKQATVEGPIKITGPGVQITGCEFNLHAAQMTDNLLKAVEVLARAAAANAEAIQAIAQRMYGPEDNRNALYLAGSTSTGQP